MGKILLSIKLAFKNLRANIGRTVLTLAGIVIGITSVIVISASGQGVKSFILGQISSFGDDVIAIETKVPSTNKNSSNNAGGMAMGIQITTLKIDDAEAVGKAPNVKDYYAGSIDQEVVTYEGINKQSLIFGAGPHAPQVDLNIKLSDGTFYSDGDDAGLAQVAVIGSGVKKSLFGDNDALGQFIKIKNLNFKVIGVLEERGTVTFFNFDDIIYIPVRTLQKKILGVNHIQMIDLKVEDKALIDETVMDLTELMKRQHKITESNKEDFSVTSVKEVQNTIVKIFGAINILLLALTSISLLVGGVGIMNVMYVSVVERTFEIGLRKAIGAKRSDILGQFLLESVIITLLGGLVGVILGYLFSVVISYVFSLLGFDLKFIITGESLLLAIGFSGAVGIVFGFYPAKKASELSPMEALRKE